MEAICDDLPNTIISFHKICLKSLILVENILRVLIIIIKVNSSMFYRTLERFLRLCNDKYYIFT